MDPSDKYLTLQSKTEGIFRDRGSRFLSFAAPAVSAEDCIHQLDEIRNAYRDARHHCYAYRLNPEKEVYRYSDDGEPNGTAGRPIYEQLVSRELFNVTLFVVRYFGGTLLGTGRLYQAYKKAAADALDHAKVIEAYLTVDIELDFPYHSLDRVMQWLDREQAAIVKKEFTNSGKITIRVRKSQLDEKYRKLKALPLTHLSVVKEEITKR